MPSFDFFTMSPKRELKILNDVSNSSWIPSTIRATTFLSASSSPWHLWRCCNHGTNIATANPIKEPTACTHAAASCDQSFPLIAKPAASAATTRALANAPMTHKATKVAPASRKRLSILVPSEFERGNVPEKLALPRDPPKTCYELR
ncbi:hypothetical protein D3C87_1546960 [compost metagenome]